MTDERTDFAVEYTNWLGERTNSDVFGVVELSDGTTGYVVWCDRRGMRWEIEGYLVVRADDCVMVMDSPK